MNCKHIDERLLSMSPGAPAPSFDAGEMDHLRSCPRCTERAEAVVAVFAAMAAAQAEPRPGPGYWGSVLPRVRRELDARREGPGFRMGPALRNALMPAAAAVALAILAALAVVRAPVAGGRENLAGLSEAELHELRLSGASTGLLQSTEMNRGSEWTVADFISDLLSEQGDTVLSTVADPEELVTHLDDERFAEVVSLLEKK